MRTVRKKLKHLSAAILILALVSSGSVLFVHAEEGYQDGHVYYNQVFGEFMNLSTIADAGLTKVASSQMSGYNPRINENGYLYADSRHPNGGDQNGYPDIVLPDVLPSDENNYTLEVDFRWANAVVGTGQGSFWARNGGFDFGFNYYGENGGKKTDAHLKYSELGNGRFDKFGGTGAVKQEILNAWAVSTIPDPLAYPVPYPTESGAGNWVSVKIAIVNGKLSKATVTVDGVPGATQDFNAQATTYEVSPGGRVYFKHCGTDFEVKQIRIVKGNYHEYTEYSGDQAEKSYSEVVKGIAPESEKTIAVCAYQYSAHKDNVFNVRIIFGLESLAYDKYGFEVVRNAETDKMKAREGNIVWTSVNGYEDGAPRVWTAEELGATYLSVLVLEDVQITGTFTFEIDAYTLTGSAKDYGNKFIIIVEDGVVKLPSEEE